MYSIVIEKHLHSDAATYHPNHHHHHPRNINNIKRMCSLQEERKKEKENRAMNYDTIYKPRVENMGRIDLTAICVDVCQQEDDDDDNLQSKVF